MMPSFVHLRVHSEYSLVDGMLRIPELVCGVRDGGMPAVAVTDQSNLFGMVKFYNAAVAMGIKPILGSDVWVVDPNQAGRPPRRLVLLCQSDDGYRLLCRLLSRAYLEGQRAGRPCILTTWLDESTDGLIALSAAEEGEIGAALMDGEDDLALQSAQYYGACFPGRFYIELHRIGRSGEEDHIVRSVDLAAAAKLPVVATNYVHFLSAADFEAHEVRVCIHDARVLNDRRRPRRHTDQQYLRSPQEMVELFADIPEAIENSVAIAVRCNMQLQLGTDHMPQFPMAPGKSVDDELASQAREGMLERLATAHGSEMVADERRMAIYYERLASELSVITSMGFSGYFLIVADFTGWSRDNGIPVGPGRGSGAGSLVAFALGITELDPLEHDLLFERFLNPERVSLPDFDIDFCIEGRDRVIEYVADKYGRDRVAQIITYGSMAARAVVRDVGRVLSMPYGQVDKIAKLIPFELKMTLDKALEQEELLREIYEGEDDVRELIDTARRLEGLPRNVGRHAGGVVIAPDALTAFTPLYCEQGARQVVTQLDMEDLEKIGLVKFDFLGLRTLTIIDRALHAVNEERRALGEAVIVLEALDKDDETTFKLLKACRTTALFQLESRGMTEVIQRLQPDKFDDLVALVALYRPGPMRMIDDFVKRKHGEIRIEYPHPLLEPILRPTYGIMLYQEQVMQIAQVLAGYSLGAADLLRRAMGKKKAEEMAAQRQIFVDGAGKRDIDIQTAGAIFDLMERFADYGFNRSHSAAYALIAYRTTWLKAHYPAHFMAASLSADMENTDRVVTLIAECRRLGIAVVPPDLNRCYYNFVATSEREIIYGLGAIKGVGRGAIEAVVNEREQAGAFRDLFDMCVRVDTRRINRRMLEQFVRAGAMDGLGGDRASLSASLNTALAAAEQALFNKSAGQDDLFGEKLSPVVEARFVTAPPWSDEERLGAEKDTLGLYLTGHPIDQYEAELANVVQGRLNELKVVEKTAVTAAGLVVAVRVMNSRRGDRIGFVTLDDKQGRMEVKVFGEVFARHRALLRNDVLLVAQGQLSVDEYTGGVQMRADRLLDLCEARSEFGQALLLELDDKQAANGAIEAVAQAFMDYGGKGLPVLFRYRTRGVRGQFRAGADWRIRPSDEALAALATALGGRDRITVCYRGKRSG